MSGKKNNSVAEAVAELTKVYNEALEAQSSLLEDANDEEKAAAQTAVNNAKVALDEAITIASTPAKKEKIVKVKFLLSPVAKFGLAYSEGETGFFDENQAKELVEAKYAEYVK